MINRQQFAHPREVAERVYLLENEKAKLEVL